MAIYEYEILGPDGAPTGILEVEQKMSDPALTHHPETGAPLRRILSSTFAHGSSGGGNDLGGCSTGTCGFDAGAVGGGCSSGTCGWS